MLSFILNMEFMLNVKNGFWILLVVITSQLSCQNESEILVTPKNFSVADPNFQMIKELEDKREGKELIKLVKEGDSFQKFYSIRALSSVQDSTAISVLIDHLQPSINLDFRIEAAFSLGQLRGKKLALEGLLKPDYFQDPEVNQYLLEALGKKGSPEAIPFIASYCKSNVPLTRLGAYLGLYRMGLRNIISNQAISTMVDGLNTDLPKSVGQLSSNFFARIRNKDLMNFQDDLLLALKDHKDPVVRMNIATALANTNSRMVRSALIKVIKNDQDFRVRVNALQSLGNGHYSIDTTAINGSLKSQSLNEKVAAVEWMQKSGEGEFKDFVRDQILTKEHWHLKSMAYSYLSKWGSRTERERLLKEIKSEIESSELDFEIAYLIRVFEYFPKEHAFVQSYANRIDLGPVVYSSALGTLYSMINEEDFQKNIGEDDIEETLQFFAQYFKQAVMSGDPTLVGYGARAFIKEELGLRPFLTDSMIFQTAIDNLKLPEEMETKFVLLEAQKEVFGSTNEEEKIKYIHPPNWEAIVKNSSIRQVRLTTSKGEILIDLDWEMTTLSTQNFIELLQKGFYDNTRFHRVENNFVVQGGCPRGDGWGGPGYAIRSEFGRKYYEVGSIGMASAGKDTEGSQWFFTHYPSHHLDGKYSNFGTVEEGMEVVNDLEIGDAILGYELLPSQ